MRVVKMNLLREYIRELLVEDLARRQALAQDLEGAENWPTKTASKHRRYKHEPSLALPSGRVLKKAFHKHADKSFTNSLTTVHWADNPEMIATLLKGSSKDEISTSAYLPGELESTGTGFFGAFGLEIKGHISLLANDMNQITTGGARDFVDADPHRTQSSGNNKGVKTTYIPDAYASDKNSILVLDKSDWNPFGADDGVTNNEALVDNWKPVAIITSKDYTTFYDDEEWLYIKKLAQEQGLEIKRTKGKHR
jgi:hypothetical protein